MKERIMKIVGTVAIVSLLLIPFTKGATGIPLLICGGIMAIMIIWEM